MQGSAVPGRDVCCYFGSLSVEQVVVSSCHPGVVLGTKWGAVTLDVALMVSFEDLAR